MEKYEHKRIEEKWQKYWEEHPELSRAEDFSDKSASSNGRDKPKQYNLVEFPYPSGAGLHVGHVRSYTALDVMSRKMRMEGKNVLYPIGWDAFGLPTENYAIKNKIHPRKATEQNIAVFRRQLKALGISFDWGREIDTTDPNYYKWTQWIFLKLFEKGLAYKKKMAINWCPSCKIGLANEEVIDGKCERCGTSTEKKEKEQWMLAITKYADRLISDLEIVDYSEKIKTQQINWIGRSEGALIKFKIVEGDSTTDSENKIKVFTTRPDTLFGCTYLVLSPEHESVFELKEKIENWEEVEKYIEAAKNKSDLERGDLNKEKTGVELKGIKAINPANEKEVPIFVADYVLSGYGTGAIMAVPAHDERDYEFAKKYKLPICQVIKKLNTDIRSFLMGADDIKNEELESLGITFEVDKDSDRKLIIPEPSIKEYEKLIGEKMENNFWNEYVGSEAVFIFKHEDGKIERIVLNNETENRIHELTERFAKTKFVDPWTMLIDNAWYREVMVHSDYGILMNSGEFDGMNSEEAKWKITEKAGGERTTQYKLRDWVFSRQHYWGEPIPLVFCEHCAEQVKSEKLKVESKGEIMNPGWMAVEEKELPVELPEVESYEPTDTGESPLALMEDWVKTTCPKCGGEAKRETDTMPNWAGSSWYYLAYATRGISNDEFLIPKNKEVLKYWMPVDLYNGGMEHTTLHLLYSRFWNKFLFDIGVVPFSEPYKKRRSHGIVLAEDGRKMSKSFGNVINPDEIAERFGADSLRLYEMFMGPFSEMIPWNTDGLVGVKKFLERVFALLEKVEEGVFKNLEKITHQTVKKVSEDIEMMKFNTAVAQMMIWANEATKAKEIGKDNLEMFLKVLAPFAPHIAEEIWERLGNKESIFKEKWPAYDEEKTKDEKITLVIQVNGKVRDKMEAVAEINKEEAKEAALASEKIKKILEGKEIKKIIFIEGKLINIVV
ncbi:MAG: class I tRNA ligase family protein [Candidatus Paceibacterota bacterium]